jgi:hypothetical protein
MTWTYNNEPFTEIPDGYEAFVYLITNTVTGRKYVGKKLFKFTRTSKKKGKRVKKQVDSDWIDYYGSNKELLSHVDLFGKEKFKREILYLCKSKGQASYMEAKEQFNRDALISEEYYNEWIMVRVRKSHLKKSLDIPK